MQHAEVLGTVQAGAEQAENGTQRFQSVSFALCRGGQKKRAWTRQTEVHRAQAHVFGGAGNRTQDLSLLANRCDKNVDRCGKT
jgi:hypothetical protein